MKNKEIIIEGKKYWENQVWLADDRKTKFTIKIVK